MPKKGGGGGGSGKPATVRITLMMNGDPHQSHIAMGVPSADNLVAEAKKGLKDILQKSKKHRLFDTAGRSVGDAELAHAQNGDIIFVSNGEDFIPPAKNRAMGKKKMKKAGGKCYSTNAAFMNAAGNSLSLRAAGGGGAGGSGGGGGGGGGGGSSALAGYQRVGDMSKDCNVKTVQALLAQRTEAKKTREFDVADVCRDKLRRLGVRVDDKARTWQVVDPPGGGRRHGGGGGSGDAQQDRGHDYRRLDAGDIKVSVGKVHRLLAERVLAKKSKNYEAADALRDQLTALGVVVDDKERTWQVLDAALSAGTAGGDAVSASLTSELIEEWQRLPKEMLQKYCQKEKWGKPTYGVVRGSGRGMAFLCRAILENSKKRKLIFPSNIPAPTKPIGEQYAALSALYNLTPAAPRQKLLPEPYRSAWIKFKDEPPPGQIEKVVERNPDARDRTVSEKSDYQVIAMSEATRMYVESVIKRCQSQRRSSIASSGSGQGDGQSSKGDSQEIQSLLSMRWPRTSILQALAAIGHDCGVPELLDWLCLNTAEADLPPGFAAQMKPKVEVFNFKAAKQPEPEPEPEHQPDSWEAGAGDAAEEEGLTAAARDWLKVANVGETVAVPAKESMLDEHKIVLEIHRACGIDTGSKVAASDESLDEEISEEFEVVQSIFGEEDCGMCMAGKLCVILVRIATSTLGQVVLACWIDDVDQYPVRPPTCVLRGANVGDTMLINMTVKLQEKAAAMAGEPVLYGLVDEIRDDDSWLIDCRPSETAIVAGVPSSGGDDTVSEPGSVVSDPRDEALDGFSDAFEMDTGENTSTSSGGKRHAGIAMKQFTVAEARKLTAGVSPSMTATRSRLPSAKKRADILRALGSGQVLVVTGETGCGKTTQVPQFIQEDTNGECFIVCTQPRRLSAIGVATRVAQERGENIDGRTSTVGYSVRGASRRNSSTRLLFCTTGVLLRRMQQQDPLLDGSSSNGRPATKISHVIVDEVHERSLDGDHLLTLLKGILSHRRDLKVILMSATINAERFAAYFNGCSIEHIPGFTHPVKQHWLEDVIELTGHRCRGAHASSRDAGMLDDDDFSKMQKPIDSPGGGYSSATIESLKCALGSEDKIDTLLVSRLIIALADRLLSEQNFGSSSDVTGSILVFLPGLFQIRQIHDILRTGRGRFRGNDLQEYEAQAAQENLYPLMLHSTVPPRDQQRVFQRPPRGLVKVVLSTNIAETSITIDDVVCVVDTLRVNQTGFDAINGIACLKETWCSQAAHRQRAGRAGRVRAGECWSLVTNKRHQHLPKFEQPEIFRVPLDQLYLRIESSLAHRPPGAPSESSDESARGVLQRFMDPPSTTAIAAAADSLRDVRALTAERKLTPLGHHLAYLPIDLRLAKIILYGAMFRCVDPAVTIAACLGAGRSPLLSPPDKREQSAEAHKQFIVRHSDHLTLLRVYDEWASISSQGARRSFCQSNFLSDNSLQDISKLRKQLVASLQEMGFLPQSTRSKWNQHAKYTKLVSAVVCAGLYPRVLKAKKPKAVYQDTMAGVFEKQGESKAYKFFTEDDRVFLHPSSVVSAEREHPNLFLVYFEKAMTSKLFIRDATGAQPYSLLLFGGEIGVQHEHGTITVDDWITYSAPARIGVLAKMIRQELDTLLQRKIARPSLDISNSAVTAAIVQLLTSA